MGKDDMTGRSTNIGVGRRKLGSMPAVDPGLAEPHLLEDVTSQIPAPTTNPYHHARETPVIVEDAAIAKFLAGENGKLVPATEVERRFGLRKGYLGIALRRRYGTTAALKEALQGSLMESGLVMVEHAMMHVEEMTPAQAILGAKIATDAALSIEKSRREAPKVIDFGQLAALGEGIMRLNAFVSGEAMATESTGLEIRSNGEDAISRYVED